MARTVGIGIQDYEKARRENLFLVDKTMFIKEWWENHDEVTLLTRPRRFGKTLNMSMLFHFFSTEDAGSDLFCGTKIWEEEKYRKLQGTYPVISLSFSSVKEGNYPEMKKKICKLIQLLYRRFSFLVTEHFLSEDEEKDFKNVSPDMEEYAASLALQQLSGYLYRYYGKKVILLLDEYDTPMQEAYSGGYWSEMMHFFRSLFNATFKDNPYLERAVMTGITRVSKESIFSDLNNLKVITTTSVQYEDAFGFTEDEVDTALREYGLFDRKDEVKHWYDGFKFGGRSDIYNPWSIINYLDERRAAPYWVNTSSNTLVGMLIQQAAGDVKESMETLMCGKTIRTELDEQIVYNQLNQDESAIWSLMVASGYLKVSDVEVQEDKVFQTWKTVYTLEPTNFEVQIMLRQMVRYWFASNASNYNDFIKALLLDDVEAMNVYMNRVSLATFSFFDSGSHPSGDSEPERFYHGFVLGMMVELEDRYILTSNRESGFGRYDVMLEPKNKGDNAIIIEFKVQGRKENSLEETVQAALHQIEKKRYDESLIDRGVPVERIRKYGFAFQGKRCSLGAPEERKKSYVKNHHLSGEENERNGHFAAGGTAAFS